jgi:hypothetical protein
MRSLCLVLALIASSASAAEIDFSTIIQGPDGPFKECRQYDQTGGKCLELIDLTLRRLCVTAAALPEKDAPIVEQVKHGKLASDLVAADRMALSAEDVAFLKRNIAKLGYSTMAVYQAIKQLDPVSVEK